jgi:hypothetical protein
MDKNGKYAHSLAIVRRMHNFIKLSFKPLHRTQNMVCSVQLFQTLLFFH